MIGALDQLGPHGDRNGIVVRSVFAKSLYLKTGADVDRDPRPVPGLEEVRILCCEAVARQVVSVELQLKRAHQVIRNEIPSCPAREGPESRAVVGARVSVSGV